MEPRMTDPALNSQKDDSYYHIKKDLSATFYENQLDHLSNARDIGFIDLPTFSQKPHHHDFDDKPHLHENENSLSKGSLSGAATPTTHNFKMAAFSPYRHSNSNSNINPLFHNTTIGITGGDSVSGEKAKYDMYPHFDSQQYDMHGHGELPKSQDYMDSYPDDPLTLMWNNDLSKGKQMKHMLEEGHPRSKPRYSHGYGYHNQYDYQEGQDEPQPHYVKLEHDLSKLYAKKEEPEPYIQSSHHTSERPSRGKHMNYNPKYEKKSTAKSHNSDREDDDDDDLTDPKNRSSRGLRVLSLKVKDIVNEKKKTSYKEVAETLIKELNKKMRAQSQGPTSKDEQNVKRRVYDALNVLIAADILKKEGKTVFCDESVANLGIHKRKKMKEEKDRIDHEMHEVKRRSKNKLEHLQELIFKTLAIKNLIARNKKKIEAEKLSNSKSIKINGEKVHQIQQFNALRVGIDEPTIAPSINEEQIKFPFIVVVSSSQDNMMNLNMDNEKKNLLIESKNPFNIFGDIDILLKMKLHYVNKKFFEDNVSSDLVRFLPPSYADSLK